MKSSSRRIIRTGLNQIAKDVFGLAMLRQVDQAWAFSEEEFWAYQSRHFESAYWQGIIRVPYYRERPEAYMQERSNKHVLDALVDLPIINKTEVKQHNTALWAQPIPRLSSFHTTSGTSGTPLRIPATLSELSLKEAVLNSWYKKLSGVRHPRTLVLSGFFSPDPGSHELFWRDRLANRVFLSIYSLADANRDNILGLLSDFQPQLIYGYASALHQLAELFGDTSAVYSRDRVAVSTSEVLEPSWKAKIEQSLARQVLNLYSSQEGAHAVLECEAGNLHIHPYIGVVEIVDDIGQRVAAGELGRVLVTTLSNRTMPLFRYELGDIAESTGYAVDCPCGIKWPTIGRIQGRSEDLVRTRDGRGIGMLSYTTLKDVRGVKESQIIQRGWEEFEVLIVTDNSCTYEKSVAERHITDGISRRVEGGISVDFTYVDAIPRGTNGKFRGVRVEFTS